MTDSWEATVKQVCNIETLELKECKISVLA